MNIYVGNISFDTTDEGLETAFATFGQVESVNIIKDRDSGRSRGFGFVDMPSDEEGQAAIDALNEKELDGRKLKVNKARPRNSGGGGRRGGNRGGGGGNYNRDRSW